MRNHWSFSFHWLLISGPSMSKCSIEADQSVWCNSEQNFVLAAVESVSWKSPIFLRAHTHELQPMKPLLTWGGGRGVGGAHIYTRSRPLGTILSACMKCVLFSNYQNWKNKVFLTDKLQMWQQKLCLQNRRIQCHSGFRCTSLSSYREEYE